MNGNDLHMRYAIPPDLLLRALRSRNRGERRGIDWGMAMVVGILIAMSIVMVPGFDMTLTSVITFLIGCCVGIGLFWLKAARVRRKLARLHLGANARAGEIDLIAGADGLRTETSLGLTSLRWAAVDHIVALRDATVLLHGGTVFPVPDAALPEDLTPVAFRDRIAAWRAS